MVSTVTASAPKTPQGWLVCVRVCVCPPPTRMAGSLVDCYVFVFLFGFPRSSFFSFVSSSPGWALLEANWRARKESKCHTRHPLSSSTPLFLVKSLKERTSQSHIAGWSGSLLLFFPCKILEKFAFCAQTTGRNRE